MFVLSISTPSPLVVPIEQIIFSLQGFHQFPHWCPVKHFRNPVKHFQNPQKPNRKKVTGLLRSGEAKKFKKIQTMVKQWSN